MAALSALASALAFAGLAAAAFTGAGASTFGSAAGFRAGKVLAGSLLAARSSLTTGLAASGLVTATSAFGLAGVSSLTWVFAVSAGLAGIAFAGSGLAGALGASVLAMSLLGVSVFAAGCSGRGAWLATGPASGSTGTRCITTPLPLLAGAGVEVGAGKAAC